MMAVGDDAGFPEGICHVHHLDLITDPVSTVEGVYRHFGMDLPPQAAAGIETYVANKPKGGYGAHLYRPEDHGLDEARERAKFRPYMVRFGVTPEDAPRRRPHRFGGRRVSNAGAQTLPS